MMRVRLNREGGRAGGQAGRNIAVRLSPSFRAALILLGGVEDRILQLGSIRG